MNARIYTQELALFLPPEQLGGKAANLAWMSREGLPVPRWWVLSTEAFRELLHANELVPFIEQALSGLHHDADAAALDTAAQRIQARIMASALPAPLIEELRSLLDSIGSVYLAVRSSVLGEDADGASFAGQMDTLLFQQGLADVCRSVLEVAASAFNARALQYRLARQIPLDDIRTAVILQEMVEGEVSGVMFTAHPVTGSRRHMLISAGWGVGEGIVSGVCNTDEFTVGLNDQTIESKLADKDLAVVFDRQQGHGTCEVAVPESQRHVPCLTPPQVLALRDMGRRLATLRGCPQDVEWTLRQGQIHLLQTRPVTRLPSPTQPVGRRIVFDNSNIQESYCGVTTPLTFSFANKAYATVYEQTMRVIGVSERVIGEHRDMLDNMLSLIKGRVYYNINNWYRGLLLLPSFNTNKADMERMMGLTDPVDLVEDKQLSWREKLAKLPQIFKALFYLTRGFRRMDALVVEFKAMFEQVYQSVPRTELHTLTPGELMEEVRRLDRELLHRWTPPIVNDFYVMMMNGRVHRSLVAAGFDQPSLLQNNLLSGEEGIESTEPTKFLLRMCAQLHQQPELKALIQQGDNTTLLGRVQVVDAAFHRQCLDYIERYGDRTMGELKLESITLRQDPSFLFAVLKNYLERDDLTPESLAEREAQFRQEAEQQSFTAIEQKLGKRALKRFKQNVARLRDAIRNRESMRLARTRMFGLYRDLFLELGRQWAQDGILAHPRDIFYVSLDELHAWYDGRAVQTNMKALVAARQQEYEAYEGTDLPYQFWTWGMVYQHNSYADPTASSHAAPLTGDLSGTGCYPGIVEEKVRLIFSPQDELSLKGQILCTVRTDPGWAPLFPTAGGILVERGSTLSHSAVVARELGIPAIVGIPGLTQRLQQGERVRMDGATGTIVRLDAPDAQDTTADVSTADRTKEAA